MRVYALFVLLMYATALNFEASLMSHTLAEVDALDTSQLNCQTPRSHFDELEQTLTQWQNVLENKERIPSHIETLTQMKKLIKHKKYQQLVEKIKTLDLISPPVLSELQSKLQGLQSHDSHEREECTQTLMKLCAYLIKQMSNVHQQCQQSPVTVIKVKGKIDDLKIIQSGCQQACQPTCDDEPVTPFDEPSVPEDQPAEEQPVEETPVESGPEEETITEVPPDAPSVVPPTEEGEETPTPPSEEEPVIEEPPVHPLTVDEPEPVTEEVIEQEEEWKVPGEETPSEPLPPLPEEHEESWGEESPLIPLPPTVEPLPEEHEESWGEESPLQPLARTIEGLPEEEEESWGEESPLIPLPTVEPLPEEHEESWGEESPLEPLARTIEGLPEEHEESWGEESPLVPLPTTDEPLPEEHEESFGEESPLEPVPAAAREGQLCHSSESTEVNTFAASQEGGEVVTELTVEGDYGFGLYFKWLQRWPENAEGTKFHLASLQNEGRVVLGLYFTYQGIQCVTQNGEAEESVNVEFDDVEGDWGFAYISYSEGQTTCAVQYFEEQPSLRQTGSQHSTVSSLTFQVGGSDGKHPSFQGEVYGQYAVSGVVYVSSLHEFEEFVLACNTPPEVVCERHTENYGDYEFNGNDDDQHISVQLNTWSDEYSVSGWFQWYDLIDQEVWHTVFRLSSNANSGEDAVLGDRDLAVYVGSEMVRSTLQFTTYTYTDLTGEGNPNLWQTVPYEDQLTYWHYIYFGYNRYEREAFAIVQFANHEVRLEFKDINHFVIPEKVLYIGYDGHYPPYSGQFYNIHVNYCDGAFELAPYTEPFGYLPPPTERPVEPEETIEPEETVEPPPFELPEEFEESWGEESPLIPLPEPEEKPEESFGEEEFYEDVIVPEQPIIPYSVPIPDEPIEDEPIPDEPLAPVPKIATPPPAPPSEPQVPAVKECEATIDVTKENAADILCAISEYLAQLASGHVPELGINPSRVCFCLEYDDSDDNESFMQLEAILKENDAHTIQKIVAQRRI